MYEPKSNEYHPNTPLAAYTRLLKSEDNYYKPKNVKMEEDRKEFLDTADAKEMLRENVHRFKEVPLYLIGSVPINYLDIYTKRKTLDELYELYTNLEQLLVNIFGLQYDNRGSMKWECEGKLYSFHMRKERKGLYEIHFWNGAGDLSLYNTVIKGDKLPLEVFTNIKETLELNARFDAIPCSDCGKMIKPTDRKGKHFAGMYCETCWTQNGWKEREANEDYM